MHSLSRKIIDTSAIAISVGLVPLYIAKTVNYMSYSFDIHKVVVYTIFVNIIAICQFLWKTPILYLNLNSR